MLSPKKLANSFSEHYVSRLDLGADPFEVNYQSNFFYQGGDRRKILEQLVHFGRFSKQAVLFIGPSGSGKTKLLKELLDQLQSVIECCRINVESLSDKEAVLAAIAERLGLKLDQQNSISSFVSALNFTFGSHNEPEPILVIVENVDLLSNEEISYLLNLQSEAQGNIHLLMVAANESGELNTEHKSLAEALKIIRLRPLSQQETKEYLQMLLKQVGYAGDFPLTERQLISLHDYARGNFTKLHEMAARMLSNDSSSDEAAFALPITHVLAIAILLVALALAYLYEGSSEKPGQKKPINSENSLTIETGNKSEQETSQIMHKLDQQSKSQQVSDKVAGVSQQETYPDEVPESLLPVVMREQLTKTVEVAAAVEEDKLTTQEKAQDAAAAPERNVLPGSMGSVLSQKEQRLLSMPSEAYMLQLLGTYTKQSAIDFTQKYSDRLQITYIESTLKDRPWYIVLVGPYENKEKAIVAIKGLPAKLQRQQPWIRSLLGIQAEISKKTGEKPF